VDGDKLNIKYDVDGHSGMIALFAWMYGEDMKKRLVGDITAQRNVDVAKGTIVVIPPKERIKQLEQLDALLLDKERLEEETIREAEEMNVIIPRREEANPMAILGVQYAAKTARAAAA
jgi:hypothetical protein